MTLPEAAPPAVRLRHVTKSFGGAKALDNGDFDVRRGEVHCLAGEKGCGKSTFIKIITGVYVPDAGTEIELFGQPVKNISPAQARALGVAVIWQDLALFARMSVAENITFDEIVGPFPRRVNRTAMRSHAATVLARLGVDIDLSASLGTLPIAERQIVAIARALMGQTRLIFMDEPTASLTQSETDALLTIVRKLSDDGVAVVFVSHRLAEVLDVAERVTVLRDGKLVGVWPTQGMTQSRLGELMTGIAIEHSILKPAADDANVVLSIQNLGRDGEFDGISFDIRAGEVLGMIGLIGAGRTEIAHALIGMNKPDRGEMILTGAAHTPRSIRQAIAAGIAYVSEDRLQLGLDRKQSIEDNISVAVLPGLESPPGLLSSGLKSKLVMDWIKSLGIRLGQPADAVSTLSGGNQQRVVLAKWLATKPRLLILDSPTVGVDVGARAGIFRIVRDLTEKGLAILLISDEASEVYFNADRILHLAGGRILDTLVPSDITLEALEARFMRDFVRSHAIELRLAAVLSLICFILSFASPQFATAGNFSSLLNNNAVDMIWAVGLLVVLIAGGIDISFAVASSVVHYIAAKLFGVMGGGNWLMGIVVCGSLGIGLGLINAWLIRGFKIISIVVTIATFNAFFGFLMFFSGGKFIYDLPSWWTARVFLFEHQNADGSWVELNLSVAAMVVCLILTWILLRHTSIGRQLHAFGANPEGARRAGVNVALMQGVAYGWMGLMAGTAGLMQINVVREVVPNALAGGELEVLAAVVLGGARLGGGKGTVTGSVLGVLFVAITQNGLNLLGVSPFASKMVIGAAILIAISTSNIGLTSPSRKRAAK